MGALAIGLSLRAQPLVVTTARAQQPKPNVVSILADNDGPCTDCVPARWRPYRCDLTERKVSRHLCGMVMDNDSYINLPWNVGQDLPPVPLPH
jgi:hypothetical protein